MNIIFFGSSNFAVPSLKAILAAKQEVSCVVTQPDRKKGRGLHLEGTVIKAVAQEAGLKIYQPEDINTPLAEKSLKNLNPDLFVVISYGQILSQQILDIPKIFAINTHASLLPKYRGAAPINRSIINGDTQTGITIIKMTKDMDAGPVILQKIVDIDNDTAISLEDKLSKPAADLVVESLQLIEKNNYRLREQEADKISFAPKLKKEDGLICWDKPAGDIRNLIRGCVTWPGAFSYYRGKLVKIYKAGVARTQGYKDTGLPGEILEVSKEGIIVATGKDNLVIEELQIEGKRRMSIEEFISGHKIHAGETFSKK